MGTAMTESEALAELKTFPVNCLDFMENQALDVAISALEEVQKLHEIGTVEEFKELKEKAKAKTARLKKGIYHCPSCGMAFAVVEQGYCIFCGQHMR